MKNNSSTSQLNCERYCKMNMIFPIQFICALGVMNGHFLMELFPAYLEPLRTGALSKTIFSYLYMGDLNVQLFFVLGGFWVPQSFKDNPKRIINKWIQLFLPAILLSIIVFVIFKVLFQADSDYTYKYLVDDLFIYLKGSPILEEKNYSHIPYILYQLWFLFPFFKTWLVLYFLYFIYTYKRNELSIVFILGLFVTVTIFNLDGLNMVIGFIFGTIYQKKLILIKNSVIKVFLCLIMLVLIPVIFTPEIYANIVGQILLFSCIGLLFLCLKDIPIFNRTNDKIKEIIYYTLSLGTSIYYVHVPIILIIKKLGVLSKYILSLKTLAITYSITLMITIFIAYIFLVLIINRIKWIQL